MRAAAKVYRNMAQRSFQKRAQYQEGRKVRGSRPARAKTTSFGRAEQEAAWEAPRWMLYQWIAAGVRVPNLRLLRWRPAHGTCRGRGRESGATPRRGGKFAARELHRFRPQVVRMLCIGLIHGDLSEFNVLVSRPTAR